MKNQFALMAATVMLLFTACNDESSTSTTTDTDSTTNNTITTNNDNVTSGTNDFEARSYMDLKTGIPLTLRRDTVTSRYVDVNTGSEVGYYYDPSTSDTFDSRGYILNNSLIMKDGNYTFDETKVMANPDNIKIKEGDSKVKIDHNSMKVKDDDGKIKERGDTYKEKTDSTKIKVTDDKLKVKNK
ncbi:MAG: hypothetical protein H0V14_08885 [Chitinophagaceae bacterium]|nr:hypothetical protein [Chitinophagaceae bacterium]